MTIEILHKPALMLLDLINCPYLIRPNVLIHNSAVSFLVVLEFLVQERILVLFRSLQLLSVCVCACMYLYIYIHTYIFALVSTTLQAHRHFHFFFILFYGFYESKDSS